MGNSYKLTWRAKEKRWRKRYKGKEYYFPAPEGKLKSHDRCYQEWLRLKAEIDLGLKQPHEEAWSAFIDTLIRQQGKVKDAGNNALSRMVWDFFQVRINRAKAAMEQGDKFQSWKNPTDEKGRPLDDGIPAPWETFGENWQEKSIKGNVETFLESKKQQAQRGERTIGRYAFLRHCLEDFADFAGPNKPIETIRGPMLTRYRDHLQAKVTEKAISAPYARDHLQALRQFIKWCWEQELLEIPRIMRGNDFIITVSPKAVEVLSLEEVKQLLGAASESTKLHLLLMLNCGMTQKDITDLRHDEIDWGKGRVTRKRSKTANHDSVPEVSYPLWATTFDLLKKHRSKHDTLALTNRNGGPLRIEKIKNGKYVKSDSIRATYDRLLAKLEIPKGDRKPLKAFRKTAASKIGEHPEFGKFAQYFLGHSPRTVADKHYVRPSGEQFDRAVAWLGEQFRID